MGQEEFILLRTALERLEPLPDAEWQYLQATLRMTSLSTGEALVRVGEKPSEVGFVIQGLLKGTYRTMTGTEFIRSFHPENTFVSSFRAQLAGLPESDVDVVALEPSRLIVWDFAFSRHLLTRNWCWEKISRKIAEYLYVERERRQFELLTMSAEERLKQFFDRFPSLPARITQQDMAAYIGITPVSLSRLRKSMKLEGR